VSQANFRIAPLARPDLKTSSSEPSNRSAHRQEHPKVSPVRAMRKDAATPEQSMHFWALCANGLEDGL